MIPQLFNLPLLRVTLSLLVVLVVLEPAMAENSDWEKSATTVSTSKDAVNSTQPEIDELITSFNSLFSTGRLDQGETGIAVATTPAAQTSTISTSDPVPCGEAKDWCGNGTCSDNKICVFAENHSVTNPANGSSPMRSPANTTPRCECIANCRTDRQCFPFNVIIELDKNPLEMSPGEMREQLKRLREALDKKIKEITDGFHCEGRCHKVVSQSHGLNLIPPGGDPNRTQCDPPNRSRAEYSFDTGCKDFCESTASDKIKELLKKFREDLARVQCGQGCIPFAEAPSSFQTSFDRNCTDCHGFCLNPCRATGFVEANFVCIHGQDSSQKWRFSASGEVCIACSIF